jgi:ABC-2 type transport system ATP-binding protein
MPAISFQSVSKTYSSRATGSFKALDGVSFDIRAGRVLRPAGPQRRRQDHPHQHPRRPFARQQRHRAGARPRRAGRLRAGAPRKLGVVPQELVFDPFFTVREALRIQSGYFGVKNNDAWIDELLPAWAWPTRPMPTCASSRAA